jgi:hypothetical protein
LESDEYISLSPTASAVGDFYAPRRFFVLNDKKFRKNIKKQKKSKIKRVFSKNRAYINN